MKAHHYALERVQALSDVPRRLGDLGWAGKVIAGGQSLGAMLNLRLAQPETLLDLDGLQSLREVTQEGDAIRFGALVTHASIEDGQHPDPSRGLMPHVARGIAYRAVRNRGTIGGSLCHADPAADWVNTLPLLGATCLTLGAQGVREIVAKDFVLSAFETALDETEMLTHIRIPKYSPSCRWSYQKFCRKKGEFAHALVAAFKDPEMGIERVVLGALDGAPTVLEAPELLRSLQDPAMRMQQWQSLGLVEQPQRLAWMDALLCIALKEMEGA